MNVIDATAVEAAFADYTNNVLRVEAALPSEWDDANPRRKTDRFPANMPFQLVVGPDPADRQMAEAALETCLTSMPTHVRAYFEKFHLIAPLQQWLIRRSHPSVTDEAAYLAPAAHPAVWRAKDFNLPRVAKLAAGLASNTVPVLAVLRPVYEEYGAWPIKRAEPLVDYADPRPEETYATPFGVLVVLRAMENRRKFRLTATGWPFRDRNVNFKWVAVPSRSMSIGGFPSEDWQMRKAMSPERGCGEIVFGWNGAVRRDVLVFARYGQGPYGPPSVVSFYRLPNELRRYDREGRIESVQYAQDRFALPSLYQNKPWKDLFVQDSLGNVIGFLRTRTGQVLDERFSITGERVTETYASDMPKTTRKVRYFTRPEDPSTLDYEVTDEESTYKLQSFVPRTRGEFPQTRKRRK